MKNQITKLLLPLAALTLATAACDPFPAKPGGTPVVLRVTVYGNDNTGTPHNDTTEAITGGTTAMIDTAQPGDKIRIQFNKPMDGASIQKYSNYQTGIPIDPASVGILSTVFTNTPEGVIPDFTDPGIPWDTCTPASNLTLGNYGSTPGTPIEFVPASTNVVDGTGVYPVYTRVCYDPSSAIDGGQIYIVPGAPLQYGKDYTIVGTVKDYEGNSVGVNVTVKLNTRPLPYMWDGYQNAVDWYDSGVAGRTYEVKRFDDVNGAAGTNSISLGAGLLPADICDKGLCEVVDPYLIPETSYWYQVIETVGGVATARPEVAGATTTDVALTPSLGITSTPALPPTVIAGVIKIAWSPVENATGYDVEQSTDTTATKTWTSLGTNLAPVVDADGVPTTNEYYIGTGTPLTATAPASGPGTLTSKTKYYFRVTPVFAGGGTLPTPPAGYDPGKGTTVSKVAP
jgi:hypothetical protein